MVAWTVGDRRRRLVLRHHLDRTETGSDGLAVVVRDLVGLHATDPVSVFLQARARLVDATVDEVEASLYERRVVLRAMAMRRTLFVVDPADLPVLQAAVRDKIRAAQRRRVARWIEEDGLATDGEAWLEAAEDVALAALVEHGPMPTRTLGEVAPSVAARVSTGSGRWASEVSLTSRVAWNLAMSGRVVRGRPGGTIASSNWTWVPTTTWLGVEVSSPPPVEEAAASLAARYLATFGPATFDDLQWWTGWTKTLTRAALARVEPVEVDVADGAGGQVTALVLAGDEAPPPRTDGEPVVALLPALDATPMGWKARRWYLGEHTSFPSAVFDRNGNVGPTVWVDGRVVGGWAQRPDGRVAWRLFDDVAATTELDARIAAEADAVASFLGEVRHTPRFPTPWQVELAAGA